MRLWDRFWQYVEIGTEDECWEWQGAIGSNGYGRFRSPDQWSDIAHRVSWRLVNEPADNMLVLHNCHNRACVNPNHLKLGTQQENIEDALDRGTQPWHSK